MTKLKDKIDRFYSRGKTGLSFFLTGGYPDMDEFKKIVRYIDNKKLADFIEIGIPFSDPVADGPVIQVASRKALAAGASYNKILKAVKSLKKDIDIPMVLMSYLNVLMADGLKNSLAAASDAGFSAVIIPDMPYGEHEEVEGILKRLNMGLVLLVSPATPDKRIRNIAKVSSPFLYYVSSYGVTGRGKKFNKTTLDRIRKVKSLSAKPVYCGFGITTPADAKFIASAADGEIIGSAVVDLIKEGDIKGSFKDINKFAISISKVLKDR
ncbi:MAG: tryptophan synthase subunit alpha [Elusimicrobia bacterium]|jgi:tryptophan synthase alpha chain|nr:tryptophan synthase subunit alpha [Elusimicrobiota bacterium]